MPRHPTTSFPCPGCSTKLRLADRRLLGTQIDCPECGIALSVFENNANEFQVRALASEQEDEASILAWHERPSWRRIVASAHVLRSPLGVAWSAAALFLLTVLLLVFRSNDDGRPLADSKPKVESSVPSAAEDEPPTETQNPSGEIVAESGENSIDTKVNPPSETKPIDVAAIEDDSDRRPVAEDPPPLALLPEAQLPDTEGAPRPVAPPSPLPQVAPVVVDVSAALSQKIVLFDQPVAAPLLELLVQLEELCGVPIRFSDADVKTSAVAATPEVSLTLRNTTVGDILRALAARARLTVHIRDDHIELGRRSADDSKASDEPSEEVGDS